MHFSPSTLGFYSVDIHGDATPQDAIPVSDEEYRNAIDGQGSDFAIAADSGGRPVLVPREPSALSREQIELLRMRTYAHPTRGSDHFFAEALRLTLTGGSPEDINAATEAGRVRHAEIKAQFP